MKGEWRYLYRAVDSDGHTLDFQLRKTRDHQAAYMFMKRLIKAFGEPTILTTDKAPALLCAFKKMKRDHRHVKRCFSKPSEFHSIRHASRMLKGIETIHAIYKRDRSLQPNCVFSTYKELHKLLVTA